MKRRLFTIFALVALSMAAFYGVADLGFIAYDDPDYVSSNSIVQRGLSWEGIAWAFGKVHGERTYWHPVTWITHMLDCQLFGLHSGSHHLVSLAFHTANVVLLFLLLFNTTGSFWTSAVAAGLFAVHPLQVESVAWITERKNLVSTFFALLTLLAYVRYTQSRKPGWYPVALVLFALALMSKPAVVTLPCVMLLLDFWPLMRLELSDQSGRFRLPADRNAIRLLIQKIPFLLFSLASALLTIWAHRGLGMLDQGTKPPAGLLFSNIVLSYSQYLRKFLCPSDLAVFYPFPRAFLAAEVIGALAVLLVLSALALRQWKRRPYLLVGWLWFLGVMVPMTGIVFVGIQGMADRFMYVPIMGLIVMLCFGAQEFFQKKKFSLKSALSLASVALLISAGITQSQVQFWKSDFELFEHARKVTKDNYLAYNVVGGIYLRSGDYVRAITNLQTAASLRPNFSDVHLTLGYAKLYTRNYVEAIDEFREALRLRSRFPEDMFMGLGATYQAMGNVPVALTNYAEAIRIDPSVPKGHLSLGNTLLALGRFKEAIPELRAAAAQEPNSPEPIGRLAWLLATHNDPSVRNGPEAVQLAEKACQLTHYGHAQSLLALAAAYAETGKFDLAVQMAQKALAVARANGDTNMVTMTDTFLKLFQSGKPYREGSN